MIKEVEIEKEKVEVDLNTYSIFKKLEELTNAIKELTLAVRIRSQF